MFENKEEPASQKKVPLEQLTKSLSANQLKVARQNYRNTMQELSKVMDIASPELREQISRGIIERIITYDM